MKKAVKIILFVILAIVLIFVSMFAIAINNNSKFYKNAEDLRGYAFGAGNVEDKIPPTNFNSKLEDCKLAYGDYWKILGLKNENCRVIYTTEDLENNDCYNSGECDGGWMTIEYKTYVCYLPKEIYSFPEDINWNDYLENEEFCFVQ